jgi:biopolymer transport protein ExbD
MTRQRKPDDPIDIILPIPSFLDMAFQILAFFIFTYNPSALEGQMELAMPASGEARAQDQQQADPTKPPDEDLDLKTELTVTLTTGGAANVGDISSVIIEGADLEPKSIPGYSGPEDIHADLKKGLPIFQNYLKSKQSGLTNKDSIKIRAGSALKYGFVVEFMDACNKAGFKHIGFGPPPDYTATK